MAHTDSFGQGHVYNRHSIQELYNEVHLIQFLCQFDYKIQCFHNHHYVLSASRPPTLCLVPQHTWPHVNLHQNDSSEFHAVKYTDFKFGQKEGLVFLWERKISQNTSLVSTHLLLEKLNGNARNVKIG